MPGHSLSTATGFVVERNGHRFLVTNWHVVTGRRPETKAVLSQTGGVPDEVIILHNQVGAPGTWVPRVEGLYDPSGDPLWREHPVHRHAVDVVALELTQLDDVDVYAHDPWASSPGVATGVTSGLSIVGFPFGITGGGGLGVWVQGTIATEPSLDFDGMPRFLIDSRTRPGQSGSPVLAYHAGGALPMQGGGTTVFGGPVEQIVGVYSGRISDKSDLGFVWKAAALCENVDSGVAGAV
jgi:Trypsin-like peptidase domain